MELDSISKTKMLIDAFVGLKVAAAAAAPSEPSSASMSVLVFEIAPIINCARVLRPPSPHSCQDRILITQREDYEYPIKHIRETWLETRVMGPSR